MILAGVVSCYRAMLKHGERQETAKLTRDGNRQIDRYRYRYRHRHRRTKAVHKIHQARVCTSLYFLPTHPTRLATDLIVSVRSGNASLTSICPCQYEVVKAKT